MEKYTVSFSSTKEAYLLDPESLRCFQLNHQPYPGLWDPGTAFNGFHKNSKLLEDRETEAGIPALSQDSQ